MVNTDKIQLDLLWYFQDANTELPLHESQYEIDPDGVVHVIRTDIQRNRVSLTGLLPVQFGEVEGDFLISNMNLTSLKGCPRHVDGNFDCSENSLTSLQHAPSTCEDLDCSRNKLTTLHHAPVVANSISCSHNLLTDLSTAPGAQDMFAAYNPFKTFRNMNKDIDRITITYDTNLPLLGLLSVRHVEIFDPDTGEYMDKLSKILNAHAGKGVDNKAQMLMCAAELVKAGYKGNAKW